jgi:hypothetical protein
MIEALRVPTPDGSGQPVHPDVVDTVDGFAGSRFWMACTPYPFGDDRLENPVIRVSDDGVEWRPVPGAPDPLVPAPVDTSRHWSDTDLTLHAGRLHLVFRGCERGRPESEFLLMSSDDGVAWTDPVRVWSGRHGVSPALVAGENGWSMWHIECSPGDPTVPVRLVRHDGPRIGDWTDLRDCTASVPGHVLWHVDVRGTGDGFEALVAAYPEGTNPSRCRLFHLVSDDGVAFRLSTPRPVVAPSWRRWNNRMVYRSTFSHTPDEGYRIWYSGASWGMRCGIGLAEGDHLEELRFRSGPTGVGRLQRLREDLPGVLSYVAQYRLPEPLRQALRSVRSLLRL